MKTVLRIVLAAPTIFGVGAVKTLGHTTPVGAALAAAAADESEALTYAFGKCGNNLGTWESQLRLGVPAPSRP
jgi:hypothetical protein